MVQNSFVLSMWVHDTSLLMFKKLVVTLNNLYVEGSNMVSNKSFTSFCNPNYNSLMNVASPHEISQVNCLNSDTYTTDKCDP